MLGNLEAVRDIPFSRHMTPQERGDLGRRKLAANSVIPVIRELLFPGDE